MSFKCWSLTKFDFDPEEKCCGWDPEVMQFLICGYEVCPDTKKAHIQGYVQFKKRTSLKQIKKFWPTVHLEASKGTADHNITYCSKDGQSHQHGEVIKRGQRSDLDDVKELVDSGQSFETIREAHYGTVIRYRRSIEQDIERMRPDRSWVTELHIHWGATGTGKSRYCNDTFPEAYWKTRGDWWDGYDGHEIVVIDEFYGWLTIDTLLRACDRYKMSVPVKGSFKKFVARQVHITSNKPWKEWWPNITNENVLAAFERRITRIHQYKRLGTPNTNV